MLDLRTDEARDVFRRLAGGADIVIENFRPGVMAPLRPRLRRRCRRRIPRSSTRRSPGYGQTGPWAGKGGFDLVAQGVTGIMSVTGEPGRPPVKAGLPVTDLGAGLFALAGILAALHYRDRTGRGQHIDTSLLRGRAGAVGLGGGGILRRTRRAGAARLGAPDERAVSGVPLRRRLHHASARRTSARSRSWPRCSATRSGSTDPRFATDDARVRHREALAGLIDAVTATATRAEWLERLDAAGMPCGPILDYAEAFDAAAGAGPRDGGRRSDHPVLGRVRTHRHADQDVGDAARPAPARAAVRRAHRRGAGRPRLRRRGDRPAAAPPAPSADRR